MALQKMLLISTEQYERQQNEERIYTLDNQMRAILNKKGMDYAEKWHLYRVVLDKYLDAVSERRLTLYLQLQEEKRKVKSKSKGVSAKYLKTHWETLDDKWGDMRERIDYADKLAGKNRRKDETAKEIVAKTKKRVIKTVKSKVRNARTKRKNSLDTLLSVIYYSPSNPASFSTTDNLWKSVDKRVSKKNIQNWLNSQDASPVTETFS